MRLYTLDVMKAIAAFFVITLHVGLFKEFNHFYGEIIRLSGRWAVPFFFMVTGFFIGSKGLEDRLGGQALKIGKIFLISSLMYLPYIYIKHDFSADKISERVMSDTVIISGMSFHLWYLSSLMFGLVTFKLLIQRVSMRTMWAVSAGIVCAYFAVDLFPDLTQNENWFRHFISLPCLFIGYVVSGMDRNKIQMPVVYTVLTISLIGIYGLPYLLQGDDTRSIILRQFPIFVIPFCIALMLIGVKSQMNNNVIADIGRDYSLLIYTSHPIWMWILKEWVLPHSWQTDIVVAMITFAVATVFAIALKYYWARAFGLLNGDFVLRKAIKVGA